MVLHIFLSAIIGLIPFVLLVILYTLKQESGRSLIKVKSSENIPLFVLGLLCFSGCIFLICFRRNSGELFYIAPLFLMSAYFISYTVVNRNSITENGIIILNPVPYLLKWHEIQRFGVHGKRIFIEKRNGYVSMAVFHQEIKEFEKIISANINKCDSQNKSQHFD